MADKPAAEVRIDAELVQHLVRTQAPAVLREAAASTPVKLAEGWDCEMWRLGDHLAVRLPRRAAAAPLVLHEQRSLPLFASAVQAAGLRLPSPVVHGSPDERFPWPWSIVPWIEGSRGTDIPRPDRAGWSDTLAKALDALHVEAPTDHPVNPVRGSALATRADAFTDRMRSLEAHGAMDGTTERALRDAWQAGLAAEGWRRPAVWIHGDLHPGNLVAEGSSLRGIVDFGDVTAGDPAYDLAIAWLAFDRPGRERFCRATGSRYDEATWIRARAWAAAIAVMLLVNSDDEPDYARLGRDAAAEVASGL